MKITTVFTDAFQAHQNGDTKTALLGYKKILRVKPLHFDALHLLGVIYFNEKRLQESKQLIKRALVVNAEFAEAHFNLGNTLFALNELVEAEEAFKKAIEIKPDYVDAYNNLGLVFRTLLNFSAAQQIYEKGIRILPSLELWHNLGIAYSDQNLFDSASNAFENAIKLKPQAFAVWDALGCLYSNHGRFSEALPYYQQALKLQQNFAEGHSNISGAYMEVGEIDKGLNHAKIAVELNPTSVSALSNLGTAFIQHGQFSAAAAHLEKANTLDPIFVKCISALGRLKCLLGDWAAGIKYYSASFSLDSNNQGLEDGVYLAILFYLSNDIINAKKYLAITQPFLASKLATHSEAMAYSLFFTGLLQHNQDKSDVSNLNRLYVIGESHSLPYSNRVIEHHNQLKLCKSLWISGCKQWHLGNAAANLYKAAVQHHFQSIPKCSAVLMTIGEIDCRPNEGIVAFIHKNPQQDLVQVTNKTISMYLDWLLMMNSETQHQIIVSGVPASNINLDELMLISKSEFTGFLGAFNQVLQYESIQRGFEFLDIYTMTNQGDGSSNGKWHIDEFHLSPAAGQEGFAKYLIT